MKTTFITALIFSLTACGTHEKSDDLKAPSNNTVVEEKTVPDEKAAPDENKDNTTTTVVTEPRKVKRPFDLVVCDGNSLTFGNKSSDPSNKSYPAILKILTGVTVYNLGINGQTTPDMLRDAKTEVDGLYRDGAYLVAWEGVNSYGRDGSSVESAIIVMKKYLNDRVAKGWKVVVMLIPPGVIDAPYEAWRLAYNAEIEKLASDKITVMPIPAEFTDPADNLYYSPDQLHFADAGYQVIARDVWATIKALEAKE